MISRLRSLLSRARWGWVPCFAAAAGLLFTGFLTAYVWRYSAAADEARWEKLVQETSDSILHSIDTYVALLQGASGLFAVQPEADGAAFHTYVDRLNLRQRYPGIQGIGYTAHIPAGQKEAFVRRMRQAGLSRFDAEKNEDAPFDIWTVGPDVPRSEYHSIIFLEPMDRRNRAAIGLDMFSEPVRHEAMARARDSGQATASGKVTLVQEIDDEKQPGFLIYVPVYKGGQTPPTVALRRELLLGFVYSPFRTRDLLNSVAGPGELARLDFVVYDGSEPFQEHELYTSDRTRHGADYQPRLVAVRSLDVAGRPWTVQFATHPQFEAESGRSYVWSSAFVGLLITVLLFLATREQVRARLAAERSAAELSHSEQQLREARNEAETANRMKDEFLAIVSHELRTPLNAIMGWSHLLHQGKLGPAETARGLSIIQRNARVQAQLIGDLLDISRIVSGKLRLELQEVDLLLVTETAIETVAPAAAEKGVRLEKNLEHTEPVDGDPARLQQVIWNLLSNAIKFTPSGGLVSITLTQSEEGAELRVADTGAGIARDVLPHIFDRFRQGDASVTRKHGGLGLGLAIVRSLVEFHGGRVWAASGGEGQGSEFRIVLPIRKQLRLQQGRDYADDAVRVALDGMRVLVVEDQADARDMVSLALSKAGAEVRSCESAGEAFREVKKFRPDVLISDIALAGEDGYSLLRRIRSEGNAFPAIALTALAREEDRLRALRVGFQEHMSKPVETDLLIATVARLVGRVGVTAGSSSRAQVRDTPRL